MNVIHMKTFVLSYHFRSQFFLGWGSGDSATHVHVLWLVWAKIHWDTYDITVAKWQFVWNRVLSLSLSAEFTWCWNHYVLLSAVLKYCPLWITFELLRGACIIQGIYEKTLVFSNLMQCLSTRRTENNSVYRKLKKLRMAVWNICELIMNQCNSVWSQLTALQVTQYPLWSAALVALLSC
jgi:hypothetical protein